MKMVVVSVIVWSFFFSLATHGESLTIEEMKEKVETVDPPDNCYRSYKAPLDLVFIIDRTSLKVLRQVPKVVEVIDLLAEEYPGSRFGMSYYANFQCSDMYSGFDCFLKVPFNQEHNKPDGCYTFKSGLTNDTSLIKSLAGQIDMLAGTDKAAGVNALVMTATDPRIHWSAAKQTDGHRNRIIFLVTDAGTNCCTKYAKSNPIVGDGSDRCSTMDNPSPEFAGEKLREKGINLFLGVMREGFWPNVNVFANWKEMTGKMPILAAQSDLDQDDSRKIVEVFRNFMVEIVYNHGTVPCKGASSNTARQLKTDAQVTNRRSSPFYKQWFGEADRLRVSLTDPSKRDKLNDMTYEQLVNEIKSAKPAKCFRDHKAPLDIVFLVDRSDMEVVQNTPKLLSALLKDIRKEYPGTRFGLNYYSDFICTDWNDESLCPSIVNSDQDHMDPDGCYTFNTTLTTDINLIKRNAEQIPWLASVNKESGLVALMMTAADGKVGWEGIKSANRNRIVFVITNDGTHCCGKLFGTRNEPMGDGSDKCDQIDNPEAVFVGKVLRKKNIKLFLALNNGVDDLDVFENWNEMCQQMGVTFTMVNTEIDETSVIFAKFKEFVLRMVYADGHIDCPKPLPKKNVKVGSKKSDFYTSNVGNTADGKSEPATDQIAPQDRGRKKLTKEMLEILETAKPPTCYRSHKNPLDLLFVIDCSAKDVLDEVPRLVNIMDDINRQYPGSRFGMAHFSDFQCVDWNEPKFCPELVQFFEDHDDPEGCYKFDIALSTNMEKIKKAVTNITFLGSINKGSGLAAVLLGSVDPRVSWVPGSVTTRNKVLFLITNDATHCCGKHYNVKHLPRADGTDKCATMDNPTAEFTGEILQREGISVFMALSNSLGSELDTFKNWNEMGLKMNVTFGMTNYWLEDNKQIFEKFKNFIVRAVYEKGQIRCKETPKKEAPKKVSKTYEMFNAKSRPEPKIDETKEMKRPPPKTKQGETRELSYEEVAALLKTATPPECYRDPTSPLDLIFVIDHSSQEVLTKAKEILGIVDKIQEDYQGTKFGVTFYSDFICTDWTVESECPAIIEKEWDHNDPEGCYTFKYPLGTPPDTVKTATDDMKILPSINTESAIAGLMMTATDPEIKWPSIQIPSRNRVAFVITDDGANCCGKIFGTRNPPKGDGTDKCISMDNPTPEFAGEKLRKQGISLFLAGGNDGSATDTFENWAGMARRMNVTFGVSNTDEDDNTEILRKFRQFLNKVVYFAGRVPCSMVKPSDRPDRKK